MDEQIPNLISQKPIAPPNACSWLSGWRSQIHQRDTCKQSPTQQEAGNPILPFPNPNFSLNLLNSRTKTQKDPSTIASGRVSRLLRLSRGGGGLGVRGVCT